MGKLTQNQRVLNHLIDHGSITQVVASNYGIRRLASRIDELRQRGLEIVREMRRDDAGVSYAYYWMLSDERHREREKRAVGLGWDGRMYGALAA